MSTVSATGSSALIKVQGLASGLKTEEIVNALMAVEERSVTRMGEEKIVLEARESATRSLQGSVQQLAVSATSLASPSLFEKSQQVTSSEPSRIGATMNAGAPPGGYKLEVSQLASAARRSFTYTKPTEAKTISIDGHEVKLSAGETLSELAGSINSNHESSVFAAALGGETLVLSDRETGSQSGSYVAVTGATGVLAEKAESAFAGANAEFKVNGVSGSSRSNTVTEAIPGVTLTLGSLTGAGAVSINVSEAQLNKGKIVEAVKGFVEKYNSAIGAVNSQEATKPAGSLKARAESRSGTLFGNTELSQLTSTLRQSIYTGVGGLPEGMSSLTNIGVSAGSPTGEVTPSQAAVEGKLEFNAAALEEALSSNPEGVRKMLSAWGFQFQKNVEGYSGPGGSFASAMEGDSSQAHQLSHQVEGLTEVLAMHRHNLEARFVALESTLARLSSQSSALSSQLSRLSATTKSG